MAGWGAVGGVERKGIDARKSKTGRQLPRSRWDLNPNSTDPCFSILRKNKQNKWKAHSIVSNFSHLKHLQSKIKRGGPCYSSLPN